MRISAQDPTNHAIGVAAASKTLSQSVFSKSSIFKDTVTISGQAHQLFGNMQQGKQDSMIESLIKQREALMEQKSDLMQNTLDSGGNLSSIKEQLKVYEKQIADLNSQIAKKQAEGRSDALGLDQDKEKKSSKSDEEKLLTQVMSLDQAEMLHRLANKMEGQKTVMKSEIADDIKRGVDVKHKQEKLSDLEQNLQATQDKITNNLQSELKNKNHEDSDSNSKDPDQKIGNDVENNHNPSRGN
ncbi:hypothetical protein [Rummeliibacillus pycnus]|uniref:hypothetical protein n=1 Tax=Rummeliibacillus pycnus TaxID=101070 RepID=UPI0037C85E0E